MPKPTWVDLENSIFTIIVHSIVSKQGTDFTANEAASGLVLG